jgi:hypothetical protein
MVADIHEAGRVLASGGPIMGAAKVNRRIVYDHAKPDATVAKAKIIWF